MDIAETLDDQVRRADPDRALTDAERAAMRCLQELPVAQREVIVLKVWHQCTFE